MILHPIQTSHISLFRVFRSIYFTAAMWGIFLASSSSRSGGGRTARRVSTGLVAKAATSLNRSNTTALQTTTTVSPAFSTVKQQMTCEAMTTVEDETVGLEHPAYRHTKSKLQSKFRKERNERSQQIVCSSVEIGRSTTAEGNGLLLTKHVPSGDTVFVLSGEIFDAPTRESIHIGNNQHIYDACGIFINHSCRPTVEIRHTNVVALKDLNPGEELTFNYNDSEINMANPFQDGDVLVCGKTQ